MFDKEITEPMFYKTTGLEAAKILQDLFVNGYASGGTRTAWGYVRW